ncbi:CATRA system-associated protein [Streptomyces sp. NPDC056921]|uniref:CATRA system-associated protein n=1 Tax=Streptomyces sp. NPDC056921 TaxID=3345966 RepID=UPI00363FA1BE
MDMPSPRGRLGITTDQLRAALDIASDVPCWPRTSQECWNRVERALEALTDALTADDPTALEDALLELELAGPVRVRIELGDEQNGVPEPVRDRAERLRHVLAGELDTEVSAGGPAPDDVE